MVYQYLNILMNFEVYFDYIFVYLGHTILG